MSKSNIKKTCNNKNSGQRKDILNLSCLEARNFFITHESYCNFDFPPYILFDPILEDISVFLENKKLSNFCKSQPQWENKLNHTIFHNKDGKYAWRPIQLIHPALYISLVHSITELEHWETICKRFEKLRKTSHIKCMSIPVISSKKKKTRPKQILSWWEKVEQQSIKMSLDYEYLTHIDIANCYGSIYTHSISWAIHDREEAKRNRRDDNLIGNIIDKHLRDMSYGQTNGIPQGSALMDFIAEMVLGYIDCELTKKIKDANIKKYDIIRYRDDYRIFTNSLKDGEKIVKLISEILIDFGMSLNPNKTKPTNQIIEGSIKPDKLYWIQQKQNTASLQKHLFLIYNLAMKFPNSGSLMNALGKFYDRLKSKNNIKYIYQLISIITNISYHNPRTYPISAAIISKLISCINNTKGQKKIIEQIREKFKKIPNTGHLDIWLQRVVIGFDENISFSEPICKLVANEKDRPIWESKWLKDIFIEQIIEKNIINQRELQKVQGVPIKREEFAVFPNEYY
ncbi:MAG: RNA-directed DNA polymerase [Bdellovibrionales bacterium]|nr:RNA-directed DNA polymerase [Bdellovibrionales bacterium]